jgi:DNA-binding PadR family transcriptional regulator
MNREIQKKTKKQEASVRKPKKKSARLDRGAVGMAILGVIGTAGLIALAVAAPNALQILRVFKKNDRRYRTPTYVSKTIQKLHRRGLVYVFEQDGEEVVRLTEKGQRELLRYQLKEKRLKKWRWDGKWRLLIFDIEEKRRFARDRARSDMLSFGFVRLQDSVWVYPYECEKVVELLKAQYRIGKEMLYIVTENFEGAEALKKKFSIK